MSLAGFAHPEPPLLPHDLWSAWTLEPWVVIPLALLVLVYARGTRTIWQRAGAGHGIDRRRYSSFLGALLALWIALVSPLDALSEALFSAHMVQHMILMLVVAPLLILSDVPLAFLWALPRPSAQRLSRRLNGSPVLTGLGRIFSNPVVVWLLFTMVFWIWHASRLYETALRDEAVHSGEHLVFLVTALLFWRVLFKPLEQKHLHYGMAIPYLFTTILQSGILGALMTFSDQPWYAFYRNFVGAWGLTPLQDQQLAGLIMWIPGGTIFTLLTIGYFAAWLRALERRSAWQQPH